MPSALSLIVLLKGTMCFCHCMPEPTRIFHLAGPCQRSTQDIVTLANVGSLQECLQLAESSKGMAANYSPQSANTPNLFQLNEESDPGAQFPRRSSRRHYLEQPEEFFNCHVLQCPESSVYTTLTNDSRFDYFSLFGSPPAPKDFVCLPEVGIFHVNLTAENYATTSVLCSERMHGSLAHVVSEARTTALSKMLKRAGVRLAFVGLGRLTTGASRLFQTSQDEDLPCFLYRAWAPGHPRNGGMATEASCVALTTDASWVTVDCERRLPYICEIFTSATEAELFASTCARHSQS